MLYHKVLIAVFLITFFNVILCETEQPEENCDIPCDENDTLPVCVWDKDEYCFLSLPSKCVMERIQCIFQKDYMMYDATFCQLEGFKCPASQSPPLDNEQIHTYHEHPEENVEVILKTENENDIIEIPEDLENNVDQLAIQDSIESDEENSSNAEMLLN
ncbi:hypothetical protein FF38_09510 [Lucilia cuprina]|uniref:Kazal-like domain-containing protein n=1 Tax=Lucilia cuprina TaxID=7375 RepID=A0A0L0CCG0_LUCCU|nr:hypothetical protein CVS40_8577 [Lucilia cuprina]KNC30123.1 hypothetical protein FF38_09510 [Lucilia cuprina]